MKTFIIDDDPISNMVTKLMLEVKGFTKDITVFEAAEDALAVLAEGNATTLPEVIFLDINMPVIDGWQLIERLQPYEQLLKGKLRIYMLTSSLSPGDVERSKEYPALVYGLIQKPILEKNLNEVLTELQKERNRQH